MANEKTAPLDSAVADKLLDLLSESDAFRELFQRDPRAALEQAGYQAPGVELVAGEEAPPAVDACCQVQQLASKEAIRAARDELKAMLLSGLAQITPNLDATYTGD